MPLSLPDAILTSDWHFREDTPLCRTDQNFLDTQVKKLCEIADIRFNLLKRNNKEDTYYDDNVLPIICAGDVFDRWKVSPFLLSVAISSFPPAIHAIPGNHDLPGHALSRMNESAYNVLIQADCITDHVCDGSEHLFNGYWGEMTIANRSVLILHTLVTEEGGEFGEDVPSAMDVLKAFPEENGQDYDLILTGDNHKSFVVRSGKRLLVNPGSLTRQTADQSNHRPCVYLYYADKNEVVPRYISIDETAVSREHLEAQKAKEERISAFVQHLNNDFEISISFEENLKKILQSEKIQSSVKNKIWEIIDACQN